MNIGVFTDFRFVTCPELTGVGKHVIHMVQGLARINENKVFALAARDQSNDLGPLWFMPVRELPMRWKMAEAVWTVTGLPYADRWCGKPDWVYCPKNDFIPIRKSRVAITVHGAHELDPQMPQSGGLSARLNRLRRRTSYARALRQAELVLTVSEFLKRQMMEWFRVDPERICVVGNGVEPEFFQAAERDRGVSGESTERPFVLCVGGLNYLDGGDRVIEFASVLRRRAPDLRVLVAGRQHSQGLRKLAAELPNMAFLGYVKAERLALYMRDAVALFFPTRYETFGIAAGEAMAAGTPVVTCASTAVPEVVGDAGLYGNVDNAEEMVKLTLSLVNDAELRTRYSILGRKRARSFTWEACVNRLSQALCK